MIHLKEKRRRRRHDLLRMKRKAIRIYHWHAPETAIKYANHLQLCSCSMCGNPRRYEKSGRLTMQERRARA